MKMFDSVAREVYERECKRADDLQEKYDRLVAEVVKLKRKGYEATTLRKPTVPEKSDEQIVRDAEAAAMGTLTREADKQFVDSLAKEMESKGLSPKEARREAMRVRSEVSSTTLHPSGT